MSDLTMCQFISSSLKARGLSKDALRIVKANNPNFTVSSMENYHNNLYASVISLEAEEKKQKGVVGKIIDWIKRLFRAIKNFIKKIFGVIFAPFRMAMLARKEKENLKNMYDKMFTAQLEERKRHTEEIIKGSRKYIEDVERMHEQLSNIRDKHLANQGSTVLDKYTLSKKEIEILFYVKDMSSHISDSGILNLGKVIEESLERITAINDILTGYSKALKDALSGDTTLDKVKNDNETAKQALYKFTNGVKSQPPFVEDKLGLFRDKSFASNVKNNRADGCPLVYNGHVILHVLFHPADDHNKEIVTLMGSGVTSETLVRETARYKSLISIDEAKTVIIEKDFKWDGSDKVNKIIRNLDSIYSSLGDLDRAVEKANMASSYQLRVYITIRDFLKAIYSYIVILKRWILSYTVVTNLYNKAITTKD